MFVVKRDGEKEPVMFDKITDRIQTLCYGLNAMVEPVKVAMRVIEGLYDGVTTSELDNLAAEIAATMTTAHPDYAKLAARIAVSNLHKNTKKSFSETMRDLYEHVDSRTGKNSSLLSEDCYSIVLAHSNKLDDTIVYNRDFSYDFFGFRTLERSYLLKINGKVVERPQHMLMRVALGIHMDNIDEVITTYELLSKKLYTHASTTLLNAGRPNAQMASSFSLMTQDDSLEGIFDTLKQTAKISKSTGGIGLSVHNVRAMGSYIQGTHGTANGILPMLQLYKDTAKYVNQGGGKRKGSITIYLEPWHADIIDFLVLQNNNSENSLCYALWIPDLFMKRVQEDGDWTLFSPDECPHLYDTYGDEFEKLYKGYEEVGKGRKTMKAKDLWNRILTTQIRFGRPYMLYKDSINRKSNQKHLGSISSASFSGDILQYTSKDQVASCHLASISLPKFISEDENGAYFFDHEKLYEVARVVVKNLDTLIDRNHYSIEEAKNSSTHQRPVGLGVQGLADAFIKLRLPFTSAAAKQLNKDIFETLHFAAVEVSMEMAKVSGAYDTFEGSPIAQGQFQFNLWGIQQDELSGRWDWKVLKEKVSEFGLRNSLLLALMPTILTSQILGNNPGFEPYTKNIFTRRVLSGEFTVVNPHLLEDLVLLNLWDHDMKAEIVRSNGSIQHIDKIPQELKEIYKTVWEIDPKELMDMARHRGYFVDQSQSMNLFLADSSMTTLSDLHFYGWKSGLKTGMYRLNMEAGRSFNTSMNNEETTSKELSPLTTEEFKAIVNGSLKIRPDNKV